MPNDTDAAEALASIRQSQAILHRQVAKSSWTYDVIFSAVAAAMVAGQALPFPGGPVASCAGAAVLAGMARGWARRRGVWVSGVTPKRARWVAIALGLAMGVLMLSSVAAGRAHMVWPPIGLAVLAFAVALYASRLWMRVYRRETGGEA